LLPALATVADLAARIPGDIAPGDDADRAAALLIDASTLVRFEAGVDWVDDQGNLADVPDIAVTITLAAATRAYFNPAGAESQQLGAASVRYGQAWLTAAEADRLRSLTTGGGLTSVLLTPGFGFDHSPVGWAPVDYGEGQWPYADWAPIGY
jgi:hypothetical protein